MSLLLNCQSISKSFGAEPLFENVSFTISEGERLGLIGPNGSGKSTFLQILAGMQQPDTGECVPRKLVRLGYVPQEPSFAAGLTVRAVLDGALAGELIEDAAKLARVAAVLGRVGFPDEQAAASTLSGGWRKRLAIASELVRQPDILLLDEPTNHLDLEGILWLEKLLQSAPFACVVVSHDRYFLENVATSMAELNRLYPEGLFRASGTYSDFLAAKDDFLLAQSKHQEALENRVRRELEWLRRGPKARATKAKARIDNAHRLMDQLDDVNTRMQSSSTRIDFVATERRTKRLIELKGVAKSLGGKLLFRDVDMVIAPGARLGITGMNGTGKTTLLRILKGDLEADAGTVNRAENLRIVYFDQERAQLDPTISLKRALAPEGDSVIYRGSVQHVNGWAKRFLFRPEQFEMPVGRLSGGERARVLIARLMLAEADVLLLDEPTNDLDIPTLETLEESLLDFPGALVLITHDRYMMDRVSTALCGLDGEGGARLFADYSQWEQSLASRKQAKAVKEPAAARVRNVPAVKRHSYLEAREWETMEQRILEAEETLAARQAELDGASQSGDAARAHEAYAAVGVAQAEVDAFYARWAELESKLQG